MPGPIRISVLADTKDIGPSMQSAEKAMTSAAATAEKASSRIDSSFEGTASHADDVASKGAQAAGAFSGLGGLLAETGGKAGALGSGMMVAGIATQAAADAGDLLNVVTESTIAKTILAKTTQLASAVATRASAAASKVAAGAQWALNAAMSANPIGLVVIALIALVAGLVLAYKKSATFRAIVNGAFASVRGVVSGFVGFFTSAVPGAISKVIGFVKARWPLLLAILTGPIGLAVLAIHSKFDSIVGFIGGMPGRIRGAAAGMFDGIRDAFRSAINWIIDKWNGLSFTLPSVNTHIPGVGTVGGFSLSTPDIPRLARGGLVIAGDNPSGIEAVVPLERAAEFGFGGRTYNITVNVPIAHDLYTVGETITNAIREYESGGGD